MGGLAWYWWGDWPGTGGGTGLVLVGRGGGGE